MSIFSKKDCKRIVSLLAWYVTHKKRASCRNAGGSLVYEIYFAICMMTLSKEIRWTAQYLNSRAARSDGGISSISLSLRLRADAIFSRLWKWFWSMCSIKQLQNFSSILVICKSIDLCFIFYLTTSMAMPLALYRAIFIFTSEHHPCHNQTPAYRIPPKYDA